jgi:dynein heavy chain
MGLDNFADEISDISGAASKELAIEQALAAIAEQWKDLVLDIDRYKDRGHYRLK